MTTGQRIAAKRKELGLSQEALGEQLGVSRQSIYKWESDTSLPEVEKLVALSRLFHVPVGWLLGVEEESGELGEGQIQVMEELLRRCQAEAEARQRDRLEEQVEALVTARLAEAAPPKKRWWERRSRMGLYVVAALVVYLCVSRMFQRLDDLQLRCDGLSNSLGEVIYSVDRQIGAITGRVESILKSQNSLTADYSAELVSLDPAANTATFSLRVVPKTYTSDLLVYFQADSGGAPVEIPVTEDAERTYAQEITCPLSDSITLSAVFVTGEISQIQLLESYTGLYSATLPRANIDLSLRLHWQDSLPEDPLTFHWDTLYVTTQPNTNTESLYGRVVIQPAEKAEMKIGLFVNQELVEWFTPCEKPKNFDGFSGQAFYMISDLTLHLQEGDVITLAAWMKDVYGRTFVQPGIPDVTPIDGTLEYVQCSSYGMSEDPVDWGL